MQSKFFRTQPESDDDDDDHYFPHRHRQIVSQHRHRAYSPPQGTVFHREPLQIIEKPVVNTVQVPVHIPVPIFLPQYIHVPTPIPQAQTQPQVLPQPIENQVPKNVYNVIYQKGPRKTPRIITFDDDGNIKQRSVNFASVTSVKKF